MRECRGYKVWGIRHEGLYRDRSLPEIPLNLLIYIGGYQIETTRKYKNIVAGHRQVSLIIDDLKTTEPWAPRAIKIHGIAEVIQREGRMGQTLYLAITPTVSWSWGIDEPQFRQGKVVPKKIKWT